MLAESMVLTLLWEKSEKSLCTEYKWYQNQLKHLTMNGFTLLLFKQVI